MTVKFNPLYEAFVLAGLFNEISKFTAGNVPDNIARMFKEKIERKLDEALENG